MVEATSVRGDRTSRKRWLRRLLAALLGLAALEVVSALLILAANRVLVSPIQRTATFYAHQKAAVDRFLAGDRDIWIFDSTLGWRTTGSLRFGESSSYPRTPHAGSIRVTGFGNSFMRGAEVSVAASWLSQLDRRFPEIETLNFGVAAFGTDQSLLQYRLEGRDWHGRVVLIGIAPDNLRRVVNVYRRFLSDGPPLTKPRFTLGADHHLELHANPFRTIEDIRTLVDAPETVKRLGQLDQWYDRVVFENPFYDWSATVRLASAFVTRIRTNLSSDRIAAHGMVNLESSAYQIEHALIRQFASEIRADGSIPVVVILPDRQSVERELGGKPGTLAPLVDDLVEEGTEVLDLTDVLVPAAREIGAGELFTSGLHYTPVAGTRIADWLGPKLLQLVRHGGSGN